MQHGEAPEELTRAKYRRFLVDTPLEHVSQQQVGPNTCFTYQYR